MSQIERPEYSETEFMPRGRGTYLGWVLFVIMFLLFLVYISVQSINLEKEKEYQKGFIEGQWTMAFEQTRTGNIYLMTNATGNLTIFPNPIDKLCGRTT